MADAVLCAKAGQKTPDCACKLERKLRPVPSANGRVAMCGTCVNALGLIKVASRSTMREFAQQSFAVGSVGCADGSRACGVQGEGNRR